MGREGRHLLLPRGEDIASIPCRHREAERAGGLAHVARRLAEDGVLRDDASVDWAADVLWVLTSFEAFDLLHTDRGLAVDDVIALVVRTAEAAWCRAGGRRSTPKR